ncbi:methylmalonyl-CoA mutase small subunit [Tannerella forsythia]|uniref:methylmalonyl-CoA mutase small subunit n=1 Tax=Tannerella forsythia TaxID=28112 RepID=UPI00242E6CF0|nr:methylmalonyl-CoA mutase small subunit [Tannerella forsythia]
MAEAKEKLFPEFPPVSTQEWMDKITADLKGVPFEKKLVWKTGEGFNVNPFYRAEDIEGMATVTSLPGEFPYVRGTNVSNAWLVRQDIEVTDCASANEKARRLVAECGVTSLGFRIKGERVSADNIQTLLEGICPVETELNFMTCNRRAVELLGILTGYYKEKGVDLNKVQGSVAYDAFKVPLVKGIALESDWIEDVVDVLKAGEALPHYRVLAVQACNLSDAGSYITQELGYAMAWGNELLAKLAEAGIPVDKVANRIKFNFGISSNYFMEIAKFRAARWLWAEIVKAYDDPACTCPPDCCDKTADDSAFCRCACKIKIHAHTSAWNMTVFDAYVNMLRTQTETMSAAIAGVDSITVSPYDDVFKTPDEFSERIARNQQLLLKEECHFDRVVDPGGGSYYIEVLTRSVAEAAWKLFLEVEDKGGFAVVANASEVQQAVNESNSARKKQIATRRISLLGTNIFPNFTEIAGNKIEADSECGCHCHKDSEIAKLDFSRGASEFEALRLETEKSGKRPKVFMLTIGNLAMRLARSQFSSNFFACAGYEIFDNLGFETVEAGVKAAREKNADIIVLCSSDDEYATFAPEAFKLTGGKELFVVAGAPACMDDLKAAGIEHFIHVRSNVLETLQMFNRSLL